jgi:hypothetical protein
MFDGRRFLSEKHANTERDWHVYSDLLRFANWRRWNLGCSGKRLNARL